ncbi:hypothetical protein BGZ94_005897, partial [Podila epigama]
MAEKRLAKELRDMQMKPSTLFEVYPIDAEKNMFRWRGIIQGPEGSPYEGGRFPLSMHFPSCYPFKPPRVEFLVKIYHPGIDRQGRNCLDLLDNITWSPAVTIPKILTSLWTLLAHPQADDPMDPAIAEVFIKQPEQFRATAREWTRLYASLKASAQ